ncbi:MAG: aminotransferase class I/II-fold pyridoxal phosphate-dependent enzyme [Pseudomonadota bacterium]
MEKYSFLNDYSEGCHPEILQALSESNMQQHLPYGDDAISNRARQAIQKHLGQINAEIRFIAGGTLANAIIAASILRPFEAVIAVESAHIAMFETGAIEATGHKVITAPGENGKLTVKAIEAALSEHAHFPHTVRPRAIYISNTTELGTVYSRDELVQLSDTCRQNGLLLWLDGARLGAALAADDELSLKVIAECADVFWIGGTKAGALAGEALVIANEKLADGIDLALKQRGAMLSKGRFLGCQFETLFTNDLFFRTGQQAHELAQAFSRAIKDAGFELFVESGSNQIFTILPDTLIESLMEEFEFHIWSRHDDSHSVVRLVTSWATQKDRVDLFVNRLNEFQ